MKVLLAPPDAFVSSWLLVAYFTGVAMGIATAACFFLGVLSECLIYAGFAAAFALMTPFYWGIRRVRPTRSGTRLVIALVAGAIMLTLGSVGCWFAS